MCLFRGFISGDVPALMLGSRATGGELRKTILWVVLREGRWVCQLKTAPLWAIVGFIVKATTPHIELANSIRKKLVRMASDTLAGFLDDSMQ